MLWRKKFNNLKINNYLKCTFLYKYLLIIKKAKIILFINTYPSFFKIIFKIIKKYDKKLRSLVVDWKITQRYFYFFININWEDIFSFYIFLSNFLHSFNKNYIKIINTLINNFYFLNNILENVYLIIYDYTKFSEFNRIIKKPTQAYSVVQQLFKYNFKFLNFFFLKNLISSSILNNFEFLTITILCFEYITVPYYYLEHWFEIQLESWIIFIKILLIKHYSNSKILTILSKKHSIIKNKIK